MPVPGIDTSEAQERDFKWKGHPIVRVRGKVKDFNKVTGTEGFDAGRQFVRFELMNITVIESVEPWEFPTWSVDIPYPEQNRPATPWAGFTSSFRAIAGEGADMNDALIGKVAEFYRGVIPLRMPKRDEHGNTVQEVATRGKKKGEMVDVWEVQDGTGWVLTAIEGFEMNPGKSFDDAVVELAVGKTDAEFPQAYIGSSELKAYPQFQKNVEAVVNRTFLPTLVIAGKLVKSGEVYARA